MTEQQASDLLSELWEYFQRHYQARPETLRSNRRKAYLNLRKGNRTAEEFRAAWVEARNDLREVGLLNTNTLSMYHEFLRKLPEDLMMRFVKDKRKYPLPDGGESQERPPET